MTQPRKRRAVLGDVLLVVIAENVPPGSEQSGRRPAVVVATPADTGPQRFPVVVVAPLTSQAGPWADRNPVLYPRLDAGQGNLNVPSVVMLDHVQAVDARRVVKALGTLSAEVYEPIRSGLERIFGFGVMT